MSRPDRQLKVAIVAGTLGQGGAEKQLIYIVRALLNAGVAVRVFSLTKGEFYEAALAACHVQVEWVGASPRPLRRLITLSAQLRRFKPDIIQSSHTFTNFYAAIAGRMLRRVSIGALRSNLAHASSGNGAWTRWHMQLPTAMLANSQAAARELLESGWVDPQLLFRLPNAIEVSLYDGTSGFIPGAGEPARHSPSAIFIGRLIPVKRADRFLEALVAARKLVPEVRGIVVGEGPELPNLEKLAINLGLTAGAISFKGRQDDVPTLLSQADMLVLTSDREGFPNVLLEAMAARLPVITTPAGDALNVVLDGVTGYVVPFGEIQTMGERMASLAHSSSLRRQLGKAGRCRVEQYFSFEGLADRLFTIYRDIANQTRKSRLLELIPAS